MEGPTSPYFLAIALLSICSLAIAAVAYFRPVFESASLRKRILSLETDIASLNSELERIRTLLKSISNRTALADFKAKKREESQGDHFHRDLSDPNLTKDELRRRVLRGSHIEIARRAMSGNIEG